MTEQKGRPRQVATRCFQMINLVDCLPYPNNSPVMLVTDAVRSSRTSAGVVPNGVRCWKWPGIRRTDTCNCESGLPVVG